MSDWQGSFPDLPVMEELGVQLEAAAARDDANRPPVQSRGPKRKRSRPSGWHTGRRRLVLWPALVALAVAAVVIPVALLTSSSSPPTNPSPGVENDDAAVARGSGPQDAWALTLVPAQDGTCLQLRIGATTEPGAQTCINGPAADSLGDPPAMASRPPVDFGVTNGPQDGFVFGTVTSTAAKVRVSAGEQEVTTGAKTASGRFGQEGLKVFVASFDEPLDAANAIEVVALDQQGDVIARVARPARR